MGKQLPDPELLRRLIDYDPDTGLMVWRTRTPDMYSSGLLPQHSAEAKCASWNRQYDGRPALNVVLDQYRAGRVFDATILAHRAAWAIVHSAWPDGEVDHIDGNPTNNRISNLRVVSHLVNCRNQKLRSTNTSGVCGVDYFQGIWRARIRADGKLRQLGSFKTKAEAVDARRQAERQHGYHENHGRTASPGELW